METTPASQEGEEPEPIPVEEQGQVLKEKPSQATNDMETTPSSTRQEPTAMEEQGEDSKEKQPPRSHSFFERQAIRVAKRPCVYLWVALIVSLSLSITGMIVGDFSVSADNAGWSSRGTEIANRHSQYLLVQLNRRRLFNDETGEVWDDLINNVQPGWEAQYALVDYRRRLEVEPTHSNGDLWNKWKLVDPTSERQLPFSMTPTLKRRLQSLVNSSSVFEGCDVAWYYEEMVKTPHLWPIWRPKVFSEPNTLLNQDVLRDLCLSEEITQQHLMDQNLCYGCSDGRCLPPYSIVLFARLTVPDGMELDCQELASAWDEYNEQNQQLEQELVQCTNDLASNYDSSRDLPESCPENFSPVLIDELYASTTEVKYTSTIFATKYSDNDIRALYDNVGSYSKGTNLIEGTYDTHKEDFVAFEIDNAIGRDMALALGSAFITSLAILIHTRSPFLTLIGLLQVLLSFPLAYFVYTFIGQLEFFPFLNFIGLFVLFALGADDIFVAVDKWKNARLEHGMEVPSTEIAAIALPDAAGAMFLTTLTTAVAFFGTAICPVAPIRCFAVFCGLLIVLVYIMCVALVFPALCIYDQWRYRRNCFCRCHCFRSTEGSEDRDNQEARMSLIRRILTGFYKGLHTIRYLLLVGCVVALVVCVIYAARMTLPTTSGVRVLNSDNEFEKNYEWRLNLLYEVLVKKSGSAAFVMWGVVPADTGDYNNPNSFTQLVLDDSFEPSKQEAQIYLRDFCSKFFANEWAEPVNEEFKCPINRFDDWLQAQATSDFPDQIYMDHCGGATSLPLEESDFDACIYHWGQQDGEKFILARNETVEINVEIMYFKFKSRVRYDSPYDVLENEWHAIEHWMVNEKQTAAPKTASGMFFTSDDFWWYDTNGRMLNTAYVAAAIAIGTAALVILLSSRSIVLTIFSAFTIGYVLASVTATLVALGWTLGFLESICFAILIGVSCDFVIHFSHAYASPPGKVDRHERTKFALIRMGPSILAAAFTTIAAATIMLFTIITFFVKFAVVLFFTILQATAGSFIVFLVLADCFGPSQPTYLFDWLSEHLCGNKAKCGNKANLSGNKANLSGEKATKDGDDNLEATGDLCIVTST